MSLTLKIATATTIVLSKARQLTNGLVFQKVGTGFNDITTCTMIQNVSKSNTAKTRYVIKRPYTTTINGEPVSDAVHVTIEVTCPESCPTATAAEVTWLAQSAAADPSFNDLIVSRSFSAS